MNTTKWITKRYGASLFFNQFNSRMLWLLVLIVFGGTWLAGTDSVPVLMLSPWQCLWPAFWVRPSSVRSRFYIVSFLGLQTRQLCNVESKLGTLRLFAISVMSKLINSPSFQLSDKLSALLSFSPLLILFPVLYNCLSPRFISYSILLGYLFCQWNLLR